VSGFLVDVQSQHRSNPMAEPTLIACLLAGLSDAKPILAQDNYGNCESFGAGNNFDGNARLVERERERQRLEQELNIAREIQQALLPGGFRNFPHLALSGMNSPCLAVGGDYFDVFPVSDDRTAFLIADVSGKGLGAALLTTMLQGALYGMKMGADPAGVQSHQSIFMRTLGIGSLCHYVLWHHRPRRPP
jgi:stage II sporulation SpoE-like protein